MTDYQQAARRAREAKERMDEAQRVLEAAEDEWHQACLELDRLEERNAG